ncbi:O-antigen ligase family protein [Pseudomonas xantholysinigenes]|uniref:O-antigen ligase family protein n=1 Tax=Pseudomonas xantholysinigenes TaxID=2745490 RepID=A0A9E6Q0B9_9PSED|nr:O-antigen ligase family protein [Pseudomonas xantholysinigenes]QXI40772.1 O-antigen ligase family protein [Pseudomonas xantholysinigenes]
MIIPLSLVGLVALLSLGLLASPYPYLAPGGVIGLAGALVLYRKPAWGLLAIAILVPLEGLLKDGLVSGAKLVGIGLVLILSLQLAVRQLPGERLRSNQWRLLLPFMALYLLSLWTSDDLALSAGHLRELLVGLVVFVITLLVGRDLNLPLLARLITVSVCVTCLFAIFSTKYQEQGRASAMLDPNAFALLITIAMPLGLWLAIKARQLPVKLFWAGCCLLLLVGMTKTESRSGLVVLLISLGMVLHNYREQLARIRPRHLGFAMLGLAIVLPLGVALMPAGYADRIQSLMLLKSGVNAHQDESLGRRASYLVVGKEMISHSPLLGTGPGTFPLHYADTGFSKAFAPENSKTTDLYRRAHNTYLELFSEVGLPAGLLFVGMIALALRNFWQARAAFRAAGDRDRADLMTHLTMSMLAIGLFLMFLSAPSHKYLWLMLALSSVLLRQARAEQPVEVAR